MNTPTHRKQLNEQQIEVLLILYKFRFATKDLIARYQELIASNYTHYRLENLLTQGYIQRNYDASYKLLHKPATYLIDNKGIRYLAAHASALDLNPKVLNLMYKDKLATDQYIVHCLSIFHVYHTFRKFYTHHVNFSTRSELNEYDYFLRPRPDAYVSFEDKQSTIPDCFLEVMHSDAQFFTLKRRVASYVRHYNSGTWQAETDSEYPRLLLVCDTPTLERRLQRSARASLQTLPYPFQIYTTNLDALTSAIQASDPIWTDVQLHDNPVFL